MINLETIFKNHLESERISDDELKKFSEDHLARITTNNPANVLAPIIAMTGAKHMAYFGAISNEDIATAVRQGMTVAVDNKIAEFKAAVSHQAKGIEFVFPKGSPEYQEFFPMGLSEYSNATKENIETLMVRMQEVSTAHAAVLSPGTSILFDTLHNDYQTLRGAQLGKKGTVGDLKDTTDANRTALELQLTSNIHFIGYIYPGDIQQCMAYFDQSFLRDNNDADTPQP